MHNFELPSELTPPQGLIITRDFIRMIGFVHTRRTYLALKEPSRCHILNRHCKVPGKLFKAKEPESQDYVNTMEGISPQSWIQIRVPESNMTMLCQTTNLFKFG